MAEKIAEKIREIKRLAKGLGDGSTFLSLETDLLDMRNLIDQVLGDKEMD